MSTLTREQELAVKSAAHQLVCRWSGIVVGLGRKNGDLLRDEIVQLVQSVVAGLVVKEQQPESEVADLTAKLAASEEEGVMLADAVKDATKLYAINADLKAKLAAAQQDAQDWRADKIEAEQQVVELQAEVERLRNDAARFVWLCEDHGDVATRQYRDHLLTRMSVLGHGAICAAIDHAITVTKEAT